MTHLLLVLNTRSVVADVCATMFNVKNSAAFSRKVYAFLTIPTETASSSRLFLSLCVTVYCEVGIEFATCHVKSLAAFVDRLYGDEVSCYFFFFKRSGQHL